MRPASCSSAQRELQWAWKACCRSHPNDDHRLDTTKPAMKTVAVAVDVVVAAVAVVAAAAAKRTSSWAGRTCRRWVPGSRAWKGKSAAVGLMPSLPRCVT